ncbi:MAG: hypothetical protein B6229_00375 [Spirochaetaceae bacterium 4572_7]|nr:MAG: hypothetical protein B6229_00375 [Spirochaetaceae bacterium 4572_7]
MELPNNYRDWAITIGMVMVIVWFGYLALNGFLDYRFKAELLGTPCDLCLELNQHVELCPKKIIDPNKINLTLGLFSPEPSE